MPDHLAPIADLAVARIGDRFRGHEAMLRQMLANPIARAYHQGRIDALSELMPAAVVAEQLGIGKVRLHRVAKQMGIGWVIGSERLFAPEDVEVLRNRPDGRRKS
jgi:hypothetical protein